MVPNGSAYSEGVPRAMAKYLAFLDRHDMRCTFFTVGDIARRYPDLIRELVAGGHEVACHSNDHTPVHRQTKESFRDDLSRCIDDLQRAGAGPIRGFRSPVVSITPATSWAYDVLQELGFHYSSSVGPVKNAEIGWPGFDRRATWMPQGMWEIPMSLTGIPGIDLPYLSGVFLRNLPFVLQRTLYRRQRADGRAVVMYCHPYDVDTEQERFMHPELGDSRFYNWLMYRGRASLIPRLERLLQMGGEIIPYESYLRRLTAPHAVR